eukprot:60816-Chlamydomonas_euryale.AAC.1
MKGWTTKPVISAVDAATTLPTSPCTRGHSDSVPSAPSVPPTLPLADQLAHTFTRTWFLPPPSYSCVLLPPSPPGWPLTCAAWLLPVRHRTSCSSEPDGPPRRLRCTMTRSAGTPGWRCPHPSSAASNASQGSCHEREPPGRQPTCATSPASTLAVSTHTSGASSSSTRRLVTSSTCTEGAEGEG